MLIVHNCLFNRNIPLGAEPSPGSPRCLPSSLSQHRGGNGQQRPFLKLSSCQSGSDIFTMLPWAHLLYPHPPCPRHCKPALPLLPHPARPAAGSRAKSTCDGQTSCRLQRSNFFFSSHLPLQLCGSVSMATNSKLTKTESMKPVG